MTKVKTNIKSILISLSHDRGIFLESSRPSERLDNLSHVQVQDVPAEYFRSICDSERESDIDIKKIDKIPGEGSRFSVVVTNETCLYFRWLNHVVYLSGDPKRLVELAPCTVNELAAMFYDQTGLFNPYETMVKEVNCTGFGTSHIFDFENNEVRRTFADTYIQGFGNPCSHWEINKDYVRKILSWAEKEAAKYDIIVANQSGMDSALAAAFFSKAKPESKKYSVHCNLGVEHWLGDYQRQIVNQLSNALPDFEKVEVQFERNPHDWSLYNNSSLGILVPQRVWMTWTTNKKLDEQIISLVGKRTALVVNGDRTSLYQHFSGTLDYKVSLFSGLVGGVRRFLHGRWGLWIAYVLSGLRTSDRAERWTQASVTLLAPSRTGHYTDKFPSFINLLLGKSGKNTAPLFSLVRDICQAYLGCNGINHEIAIFHSIARDQLLYAGVLRNSSAIYGPNIRFSLLGAHIVNYHLSLSSQKSIEVLSPKKNIRVRLKILGIDIDKIVSSVQPPVGLRRQFWMRFLLDHIRMVIPQPLRQLLKKCIRGLFSILFPAREGPS